MAIKKVKVTKINEETRRDTFQRGIKQGGVKQAIDKGVAKLSDPASDYLNGLVEKVFPAGAVADPAIKGLMEFAVLFGASEIVNLSSGMTGAIAQKIPGLKNFDPEKMKEFSKYLRGYSGEKMGDKTADGIFKAVPKIVSMISNPAILELMEKDPEEEPKRLATKTEVPVKSGSKIPLMVDGED